MTVKEYKQKLKELHVFIKENPFRRNYEINAKCGKAYFDYLYKYAETFYHLTKDIQRNKANDATEEDKKLAKVADAGFFCHDFIGSINRSCNAIESYNCNGNKEKIDILHKEEEFIELCISCIHCYFETGCFYRYPLKWRGSMKWAEWNNEKNDYAIDFSKEYRS